MVFFSSGFHHLLNNLAAPRKTVRVRFQLRKECVFGEHFFILGDDSVFGGLWEPENALPLTWSDGHVWTVDLVGISWGISASC